MRSESGPRGLRVAMLLHKTVEHDSRVRREARALQQVGHDVTVVHLPAVPGALGDELDGYRLLAVTPPAWVRRLLPFHLYRIAFLLAFVRALRRLRPDVVHAHDAAMLAPGWLGARLTGARLVYDSHELATGVPYRERLWARFVAALERAIVPRCDAVITVSDGIAARLRALYRLDETPTVVRNVPDLEGGGRGIDLRAAAGLGGERLILHLGAPAPRRGCETLVRALRSLPDARVVFLGDPWPGYGESLELLAHSEGVGERVRFLASVSVEDVVASAASADVGVSLLSGDCENHRLALPNKVFEYVAAGVPVVTNDLPELRALVQRHEIGRTAAAEDPEALAAAVAQVLDERERFQPQLERAAAELCWQRERTRLTRLYDRWRPRPQARRALVVVRNPCTHDARVLREARLLRRLGFETAIVASASSAVPAGQAVVDGMPIRRLAPGSPLGWLRPLASAMRGRSQRPVAPGAASTGAGEGSGRSAPSTARRAHRLLTTLDWYRRGIGVMRRERPALVHCNDYNTMWIGVAAKLLGARVVYDSHELWPDRNLRPEWRRWLLTCEWLFVRVADRVVTTSPGYADVLARRHRIPRPVVVRNIPEALSRPADGTAHSTTARRTSDAPLVVYFGALTTGRGLEQAIHMLRRHPSLRLRLVGPDAWGFRTSLERLAEQLGVRARLDLRQPVAPAQAADVLEDADLALALIEPVCLSYVLTLPNKLFEYVSAGVPILTSDFPAMASFIADTGAGVTVDPTDAGSIDAGLAAALDPARNASLRVAARRAAERLTWSAESRILAEVYGQGR